MIRKIDCSPGGIAERAAATGRSTAARGEAVPAGDELQAAIDRAVASFQAGERREESFRFLFETYHHRIRGFFARRTDSVEDCLDLTQETFLRVDIDFDLADLPQIQRVVVRAGPA